MGLFNISDECPSIDSNYKLFRRIAEYEQNNPEHVNLYKKIFQDLTAKQVRKYKIAGRVEKVIVGGAYQSKENREFAASEDEGFELVANGLQGKPSRFDLELQENGSLEVTDKQTAEVIIAKVQPHDRFNCLPTACAGRAYSLAEQ